jgi:hypothetical protein
VRRFAGTQSPTSEWYCNPPETIAFSATRKIPIPPEILNRLYMSSTSALPPEGSHPILKAFGTYIQNGVGSRQFDSF